MPPTLHLAPAILKTAVQLRKAAAQVLRKHGFSPAQFNILDILSEHPEGVSAGAFAEELVVDPSNITGLLNRMKRDGLLLECPSPDDARRRIVRLSAKGKARWEKAYADYRAGLELLDSALAEKGVNAAALRATEKTLAATGEYCRELLDQP